MTEDFGASTGPAVLVATTTSSPFVVTVHDASGNTVPDVSIDFAVTNGDGQVSIFRGEKAARAATLAHLWYR